MFNREALKILKFLHQRRLQEDKSFGWTPIEEIEKNTKVHSFYVRARMSYLQHSGFVEFEETLDRARISKDGTNYIRDRGFNIFRAFIVPIFVPIVSVLISLGTSWLMQRNEQKKAEIYRENTRKIAEESLSKAEESNKIAQSSLQTTVQPQIAMPKIYVDEHRLELELYIKNYGNVAYNIQVFCNLGNTKLDYLQMSEWVTRTTQDYKTVVVPKTTGIMSDHVEYTEKSDFVSSPYEGWSSFQKTSLNSLGVNAYVLLIFKLPNDFKKRIENKEIFEGTFKYEDRLGTKHSIFFESKNLEMLITKINK